MRAVSGRVCKSSPDTVFLYINKRVRVITMRYILETRNSIVDVFQMLQEITIDLKARV